MREFFTTFIFSMVAFVVAVVVVSYFSAKNTARRATEHRLKFYNLVTREARLHADALSRRRNQLLVKDIYNNISSDKWDKEIILFSRTNVFKEPKKKIFGQELDDLKRWINEIVDERQATEVSRPVLWSGKTGVDFEIFCKVILETNGWSVATTPASGDQGADLIATRNALRAVIQCKFYSSPVGNKAIQEAYTAKTFYDGSHAIVVTNSSYTASAKQLAATNKVYLLHHDELQKLEEILRRGLRLASF